MMNMGSNPFERQSSPADKDRLVDVRGEVAALERECLFEEPVLPTEVESRVDELKATYADFKNETRPLEYIAATAWHELGNAYRNAALAHLESEAYAKKIPIPKLTQEDVDAIGATFPDQQMQHGAEDQALRRYAPAVVGHWKTIRQETADAQVLQNDLKDRVVQTRLRGEDRDTARVELLAQLGETIDSLPRSGKQSELKLMYVLRKCVLDQRVGHLVQIEHGLPREDFADEKVDVRLILGPKLIPLQIKTEVTADAYRREHYEQVRAKSAAAIEHQKTRLATIDTEILNTAYKYWGRGGKTKGEKASGTRAKNQVLKMLEEALPTTQHRMFSLLKDVEPSEAPPSSKRITRDFLARNSGVPVLVALGLLSQNAINANNIRHAKDELAQQLPVIAKVFGSQEAFQKMDPELVSQFQKETKRP